MLEVLGFYIEGNVSKMRADLSQLEHPLIASPPPPSQWPHSVVDRQHVCTLCWVEPNKEIILVLGTECYLMFVCNGMLCTLQNNNDSSDRGITSALLPHLWERFWIPQRDVLEMGRHQRCRPRLGSISYVNMLARLEECTRVKKWASQAKNQANMPLTAAQQITYN